MPAADGGLGTALVGEKIAVGQMNLSVTKLLGEGGFSYVYLVKDSDSVGVLGGSSHHSAVKQQSNRDISPMRGGNMGSGGEIPPGPLVLKVTSIHSRSQRDIAEKEAKLLSRLSHPSIIKMYHGCYRQSSSQQKRGKDSTSGAKERPQHLILMEYCEGGHALDVCSRLAAAGQRFDLSALIIAFGQICNAVSYLHAQRPPIVHRDLKPVNFLVKNGAYKLCDFGSAVFGHVDLRTPKARAEAEEVVQKTTTQMFRAPEMVDLYVAKKLTQATDVWALGCCLYSLAFLRNCFEEGSNLAIISRKYTIPEDNPYGDGLVELIDRMLTVDYKARADMTEVILCLSAVYSGRPLPPRKKSSKPAKPDEKESNKKATVAAKKETPGDARIGKFRTDSQGIHNDDNLYDPSKVTEGKKLASNSVAARRKRAAAASTAVPATTNPSSTSTSKSDPLTFSSIQGSEDGTTSDVGFSAFGDMNGFDSSKEDFFNAFDQNKEAQKQFGANDGFDSNAFGSSGWGDTPTTTDAATDNLQKLSLSNFDDDVDNAKNGGTARSSSKPRRKSLSLDAYESSEGTGGSDGDGDNKTRRKSNNYEGNGERATNDPNRPKQRRKSYGGGGGGRSRAHRDTVLGLDAEKMGNDGDKKERRHKKEGSKSDAARRRSLSRSRKDKGKTDEERRKRSLSRSRRKPRRASNNPDDGKGSASGDLEKNKKNSIRNMFNRKQSSDDP